MNPEGHKPDSYSEKLVIEEMHRQKHIEKLEQDKKYLEARPWPLMGTQVIPELVNASSYLKASTTTKEGQQKTVMGLPNLYGWMIGEYPDNISDYPHLGAPSQIGALAVTAPSVQQVPTAIEQPQVPRNTMQSGVTTTIKVPRILSASSVHPSGVASRTAIMSACDPGVAANLVQFDVTAEEVFTFFARHYRWPGYMIRFIRNGWDMHSITNYINWARDLTGNSAFKSSNLAAAARLHQINVDAEKGVGELRLSPSNWGANHQRKLHDILLVDMADQVVNWPSGLGCGPLTKCIQYAVAHPAQKLKLSDVEDMIQEHGFSLLQRTAGDDPDGAALQRFESSGYNVQRDSRT